jgi:DNA-directed RNA polymerase subunit RPC12/RpoP
MITQVKWNTEMPKFEDVENKITLVWWEDSQNIVHTDVLNNWSRDAFENNFKGMVKFTILSDEPVYCEWTKDEDAVYHTKCGHQFYFDDSSAIEENHHVWCQYCGSVIHIVDELKPLPLDEVMPKIIDHYNSESFSVEYEKDGWKYSTPMLESTEAAITAWNSLVKKLTGEK